MRGNKKLAQGIAVAGATGVLVCTVTFSQPQIMQTEETIKITENGMAGIMTTWSQKEEPEATIEKLDIDTVSSALPFSSLNTDTRTDDSEMPIDASISAPYQKSTSVFEKTKEIKTKEVKEKDLKKAKDQTKAVSGKIS